MSDKKKVKGIMVTTPTFRLAFPKLEKPEAFKGKGTPVYSCTMLFSKDTDLTPIKKAMAISMAEAFGKDKAKWPDVKKPFRDGNKKEKYDGYKDTIYCNSKNQSRPVLVDRDKSQLSDATKFYPGCYCQAVINVKCVESGSDWYQTFYLQAIRFVKDGEQFGGANVDVDSAFDDLPDLENDESSYSEDSNIDFDTDIDDDDFDI